MRKEIIETGKTLDAAIDAACDKLGCVRDQSDLEIEVIDRPKKGFLGLKNIPARVRVSIELPDEKPAEKPQPVKKSAPAPRVDKPERAERPERRERREQAPAPRPAQEPAGEQAPPRPAQQAPAPTPVPLPEERPREVVTQGFTEKETLTMEYISSILREFGITAQIQLSREEGGICLNITGEGLGTIIGRRGETLDAIQYLSGLVANRMEGEYLRVTVDCGDYRNKRKETLEALARKLSAQVLKTNVSKTLEPMNPFERRVIHATVSTIEGVTSSSVGEEPGRRVVITSPTARRAPSRGGSRSGGRDRSERGGERRGGGGRGGRDHRDSRDSRERGGRDRDRDERPSRATPPPRPSAPTGGPPKETPEAAAGGGLYEKVDLE